MKLIKLTSFLALMLVFFAGLSNAQTSISSNLNGRPNVYTNIQENFNVAIVAGPNMLQNVVIKLTLANPSQGPDMAVEYNAAGTWTPLVFDPNGEVTVGPAPLFDNVLNCRATFASAGNYNYTFEIIQVSTSSVLAQSSESVVVSQLVSANISSDLNGRPGVVTGIQELFTTTTSAGTDAGKMSIIKISLTNPAQASDISLEYDNSGTWTLISFDAAGEAFIGGATGFPLANATDNMRVEFSAAGTYAYSMEIIEVSTSQTLGQPSNESVVVSQNASATITSDLNNRPNVYVGVPEQFSIDIVAGNDLGKMVNYKLSLDNPSQASDITMELDAGTSWMPLAFDANGVITLGIPGGFPLSNGTYNLRATFTTTGTYAYSLEINEVSTGLPLGNVANESVTVSTFAGATISSNLHLRPNVVAGVQENLTVDLVAGTDAGIMSFVAISFASAAMGANVTLELDGGGGNWLPVTITNGVAAIGAPGSPLMDATIGLRVSFSTAGNYTYTLEIIETSTGNPVGLVSNESVMVGNYVPAVASSNLNGKQVIRNVAETFNILINSNNDVGKISRSFFELSDPSKAADVKLEFNDNGIWVELSFDANGSTSWDAVSGIALASSNKEFRATFKDTGTYEYKISIMDLGSSSELASSSESVEVTMDLGISKTVGALGNVLLYPNPVKNVLSVKGIEGAVVSLFDLTGRNVFEIRDSKNLVQLDISFLPEGLYVVRISKNNEFVTRKITIVR